MKKIPLSKAILAIGTSTLIFVLIFVFGVMKVSKSIKIPAISTETVAAPKPEKKGPGIDYKDLQQQAMKLDQWSQDLTKKEKQNLEEDKNLRQREEAIKAEEEKINNLQKQLEDKVLTIQEHESHSYEEMAVVYGNMKPEQASALLRKLTDEKIARLLTYMKSTHTSKLLEGWVATFPDDADRVAKISDQMRLVVVENTATSTPNPNPSPTP